MKINSISLLNYRNYDVLELNFNKNLNLVYGLNGSGKTNLIEAIYLLSLTKSFRINNDKALIRKGAIKLKVIGNIEKNKEIEEYKIEISNDGKLVYIDNNKLDKISDYIAKVNVTLFNPSDTRIVDASPDDRRKVINIELSQLYKDYLIVLSNYNKVLKQRNFYLRGMLINGNYTTTYLDIITKKLIEYGRIISKYRNEFIEKINIELSDIYNKIFSSGSLKIRYVSTFKNKDMDFLLKKYHDNYKKEMNVGKTIDGIHHDDIIFILDNNNLKDYGSEGQKKNAIISFKLALVNVIKELKGYYPILVLDDLFSELDKEKVNNLLKILNDDVQTFITTTDIDNVLEDVKRKAKKFKVSFGSIVEE